MKMHFHDLVTKYQYVITINEGNTSFRVVSWKTYLKLYVILTSMSHRNIFNSKRTLNSVMSNDIHFCFVYIW